MNATASVPLDYAELARHDRTHVSLYTSPQVFDDEMQRIFHRSWVYVAHESEVPEPGDFKTTFIGQVPVIVTRDAGGRVHVLTNRCTHRGATVCALERGRAEAFTCPYHAWTFGLDGRLQSVGFPRGYNDGEVDFERQGLVPAAAVDSYRGLIFAGLLATPDITLDDKLAGAKPFIDMNMDLSPAGELVVGATGVYKHTYRGNWKIQMEGSVEGYHAAFTHQTAFDYMIRRMGFPPHFEKLPMRGLDVGHGNNVLEIYRLPEDMVRKRWPPAFVEQMIAAHGRERAMEVLGSRFNLVIFPNFAILEYQFRVIRPIRPDLTEVRIYHTTLKDAPHEVNLRRIREHEFFYGPAGFGFPDDARVFERIQEGFRAQHVPWVMLNRGVNSEQVDEAGRRVGAHTQETQQRAPYYEYRRLMTREVAA